MSRHLSDKEIWIAANQMIQSHQADAERQALLWAKQMKAAGDLDGHHIWLRVVAAIKLMQKTDPDGPMN